MLINEILNLQPQPYKWTSASTCEFSIGAIPFGIVLETYPIMLPTRRSISVVNISFGRVIDTSLPVSADNIDRTLTNFGQPRTVMATVASACVNNPTIRTHDMFIVAASDQVKQKRIGVYTLAISELTSQLTEYQHSYTATTSNGSLLVVTSKIELTQEEIDFISTEILHKDQHA